MSYIVFLYGLLIGSFLNVCYYRIPNGLSIVFPGSRCGSCLTPLKPWDLIPVVSWVLTKGHCRYCKEKVSIRYPIGELLTAMASVWVYSVTGFNSSLFMGLFILYIGIVVIMIDLKHMIIPNGLNLTFFLGGLIFFIFQGVNTGNWPFLNVLMGAAIGFVPLFIIALFEAMGGGDYKYMAAAGFILGPQLTGMALYIAFLFGGAVSLILLLFKKYGFKSEVPFGPFLVFGVLMAYLYGNELWLWYQWTFLT